MYNLTLAPSQLLQQVRSILVTTPGRWQELANALDPELSNAAPKAGEWSAVECLQHLIDVEPLFQSRLDDLLQGRPEFPAYTPATDQGNGHIDMGTLTARFVLLREKTLRMLESVTQADFQRQSRHAKLGPVTLGELLHEWAAHDLNHTIQAERAIAQPFIRGCGPWKSNFTDMIQE